MLRRFCATLLVLLAMGPAQGRELHSTWIDPDALALQRLLPPPQAGSAEAQADMQAVRSAIAARTPEDEARITQDLPCTLDRFTGVLGPDFSTARMPVTAALTVRVFEDGELAVITAKRAIGRPRPYTLDPGLATFGHRSDSSSYPSGHATFGHLAATVLAALVPEKSDALFARAAAYGRNRMIAGTHFPSDLEAGKVAAAVIAEALVRDSRFREALESARGEVRRVTAVR